MIFNIFPSSICLTVVACTSGNLVIQVQHGFSLKKKPSLNVLSIRGDQKFLRQRWPKNPLMYVMPITEENGRVINDAS